MRFRALPLLVIGAILVGVFPATSAADESTHVGLVVKAAKNTLTMTDMNGKNERDLVVADTATIMVDGKQSKLEEMPKGSSVVVTMENQRGRWVVIKIEARKPPMP